MTQTPTQTPEATPSETPTNTPTVTPTNECPPYGTYLGFFCQGDTNCGFPFLDQYCEYADGNCGSYNEYCGCC
jgi:hypothetical protein